MSTYFAVRRAPGSGWEAGRPLRSQPLWAEHAEFMNGLLNEKLIIIGGPIGVSHDALLIFRADNEGHDQGSTCPGSLDATGDTCDSEYRGMDDPA